MGVLSRALTRAITAITQNIFTSPHQNWLDNNGKPLANGLLYVYAAGTATPVNTWQDEQLTILNTNPVVLDAGGFTTVWLNPADTYKFRMVNRLGEQQWTVDNYQAGSLTANILVPLNFIIPAFAPNDIFNGQNQQIWRWQLTGANETAAMEFAEPLLGPSTNTWVAADGSGRTSAIVNIYTFPGSTAMPLQVIAQGGLGTQGLSGNGFAVLNTGNILALGTAIYIGPVRIPQLINAPSLATDGLGNIILGTAGGGPGPGGGIASINSDTTPAQQIISGPGIDVTTAVGTGVTTISLAAGFTALTLSPTSVLGGGSSTGTVTVGSPALAAGVNIVLTSSNPTVAQVPASVTIASGATTATFTVTTTGVASNTTVTISGSYSGVVRQANLTVTAPAQLSAVSLNPTSVISGGNSTGTVTLTTGAPAGGAVVSLTSNSTAVAQVPATVTVAQGATTANFTVTTSTVASSTTVTITGNYVVTQSANLTVNPQLPIYGGYAPANDSTGVTFVGSNLALVPYTGDFLPVLQTTAEQVGQSWAFTPSAQCICLVLYGGSHTFIDQNNNGVPFVTPVPVTVNGNAMFLYSTQFLQSAPITVKVAS